MGSLRVGVVGTGHLGRHHVRILAGLDDVELVGIHDERTDVAAGYAEEHGTVVYPSVDALAQDVDAAVVAVPTVAHADVGCRFLERGVHVLVEKPIAPDLEQADRLIEAAGDLVLAVGHVEFHNPAVQALLGAGGSSRFVEIERLSPFTPRSLDVDVLLDLMIHDLQILHRLDPSPVAEIRATGIDVLTPRIDIANARIELESGLVANVTASRVSADAVRKLRVFQHQRYWSIDYREQDVKGYSLEDDAAGSRQITPVELAFDKGEPLRAELEAFVAACRGGDRDAVVDGREGRRALATALEIGRRAREGGR